MEGLVEGLPVLASVEPVIQGSRWVELHLERLGEAVDLWGHLLSGPSGWRHPCHYFDSTEETARWIFVLDLLNHCFWPDEGEPVWSVELESEEYSGYWGLAAGLKRAMEEGTPITSAGFLENLSRNDLEKIFRGRGRMPLLDERLDNLREAGGVIRSRFGGDIVSLLDSCRGSAVETVKKFVSSFPSFRDEALFEGKRVYFWKRAQILAADLYSAFEGKGWGAFGDIRSLTAFADYKLPQVLREMGVISYEPQLAEKIDRLQRLTSGSREEVEIRAATIWAVEAFREPFSIKGREAAAMEIDNWLWQLGQLDVFRNRPYHRCRTIFY